MGIDFDLNGVKTNVKVELAQLSGDNLGLHSILGFTEGFTANFPCRRCRLHRQECQKSFILNDANLRTVENYTADLRSNNFSATGINFESVLNRLPYHHVTKMVVFDIMHDTFEGVGMDLVILLLQHLISQKFMTLDKLNHRIESFDYGRHFCNTKPSIFKQSYLKGDSKSGQNASQSLCLITVLPLLIGDLVPVGNIQWNLFLTFREILDILMAPSISKGGLTYVDSLISEFCMSYQGIFKKLLKPKHHHLLHYASSIELIGPLHYFWSMAYEAKHKFFKTNAHMTCNFRNIAKSVCYRHQLSRSFRLLSKNEFYPNDFHCDIYDTVQVSSLEFENLIRDRFNMEMVKISNKATLNGLEYRIGSFVYLGCREEEQLFGRIELIILEDGDCSIIISEMSGEYDNHFCSYVLNDKKSVRIIDINDFAFFLPLYSMQSFKLNDLSSYMILPIKLI